MKGTINQCMALFVAANTMYEALVDAGDGCATVNT
jgi:hypothetical protein